MSFTICTADDPLCPQTLDEEKLPKKPLRGKKWKKPSGRATEEDPSPRTDRQEIDVEWTENKTKTTTIISQRYNLRTEMWTVEEDRSGGLQATPGNVWIGRTWSRLEGPDPDPHQLLSTMETWKRADHTNTWGANSIHTDRDMKTCKLQERLKLIGGRWSSLERERKRRRKKRRRRRRKRRRRRSAVVKHGLQVLMFIRGLWFLLVSSHLYCTLCFMVLVNSVCLVFVLPERRKSSWLRWDKQDYTFTLCGLPYKINHLGRD